MVMRRTKKRLLARLNQVLLRWRRRYSALYKIVEGVLMSLIAGAVGGGLVSNTVTSVVNKTVTSQQQNGTQTGSANSYTYSTNFLAPLTVNGDLNIGVSSSTVLTEMPQINTENQTTETKN